MSRTLAISCGVICAGFWAGCGGSQHAARGYLYRYGNGESFIQLQRHGRHVHGTISTTQFAAQGPAQLLRDTGTVKGTIWRSTVYLHLSSRLQWEGKLSSFGLVILREIPSGTPIGVRYRPATIADYNAAAAQTEATVESQRAGQNAESPSP